MIGELENSELYNLEKTFDKILKEFPNARKKLVSVSGKKLYDKVRENIRRDVKENTGKLLRGVTMVVGSGGGYVAIRANHSIAPHSHLIENGHRIVTGKRFDSKIYNDLKKVRVTPERTAGMSVEKYRKVIKGIQAADMKKADTRVYSDDWVPGKHMYRNALNDLIFELENDAEEFIEKIVGEAFG